MLCAHNSFEHLGPSVYSPALYNSFKVLQPCCHGPACCSRLHLGCLMLSQSSVWGEFWLLGVFSSGVAPGWWDRCYKVVSLAYLMYRVEERSLLSDLGRLFCRIRSKFLGFLSCQMAFSCCWWVSVRGCVSNCVFETRF